MMDDKYLAEIKARIENAKKEDHLAMFETVDYYCKDVTALLADIEQLTKEDIDYPHTKMVIKGQQNQNTRLREIIDTKDQQIATLKKKNAAYKKVIDELKPNAVLKKAFELACDEIADSCCPFDSTDYNCPDAHTCSNVTGGREDHGRDKECWYKYLIRQAQEAKDV